MKSRETQLLERVVNWFSLSILWHPDRVQELLDWDDYHTVVDDEVTVVSVSGCGEGDLVFVEGEKSHMQARIKYLESENKTWSEEFENLEADNADQEERLIDLEHKIERLEGRGITDMKYQIQRLRDALRQIPQLIINTAGTGEELKLRRLTLGYLTNYINEILEEE